MHIIITILTVNEKQTTTKIWGNEKWHSTTQQYFNNLYRVNWYYFGQKEWFFMPTKQNLLTTCVDVLSISLISCPTLIAGGGGGGWGSIHNPWLQLPIFFQNSVNMLLILLCFLRLFFTFRIRPDIGSHFSLCNRHTFSSVYL